VLRNLLQLKLNFLFFLLTSLWLIGILWEVFSSYFNSAIILLPFLKYNFSLVCHTQSEKLFNIGQYHTLVCSRCFGIYSGVFIASFLSLFDLKLNIKSKLFILTSIPLILDVLLSSLNFYQYSKLIALFTGVLLGFIGYFYIIDSLNLLFNKKVVVKP